MVDLIPESHRIRNTVPDGAGPELGLAPHEMFRLGAHYFCKNANLKVKSLVGSPRANGRNVTLPQRSSATFHMPTFKVVVIGASGVGKTSLRGQYISARFSTSYRATIGADFITKTLPPITPDGEPIVLQIWDTAGQERFSSLASAFFRGADAAVLMYDVTTPETMHALGKWWAEFRDKAPVADEDLGSFCAAVVGNKVDLLDGLDDDADVVLPAQGARFVRALIPRPDTPPPSPGPSLPPLTVVSDDEQDEEDDPMASSQLTARPGPPLQPISILRHPHLTSNGHRKKESSSQISFTQPKSPVFPSASRASSHSRGGASTLTSTLTIYHTPSSSVFSDNASEYYHSAQSSVVGSDLDQHSPMANGFVNHSPTARSASEITITPARFSASSSHSLSAHSRDTSGSTTSVSDLSSDLSSPMTSPSTRHSKSPSPVAPTIDTACVSPFGTHKTAEERARDEGPSSAALSPLPYQQHFPFSALAFSAGPSDAAAPAVSAPPTTAVSKTPAESALASLPAGTATATANGNGSAHDPPWLAEPDVGAAGAAHFRVSARTGAGVADVFGWVARRLVAQHARREAAMSVEDDPRASVSGHQGRAKSMGGAEERLRINAAAAKDKKSTCC
ncbi:hypothetical protein GGX14DRAFT_645405 [Mycena pura]|uniref:Ras-domain-containing protein n=1 Tax=Mycena pura TaxID=153505 RepID=A0AAD6V7C2_9AGAR|nr:hypothetical protein GGX14DRAFT_645405 [Mycena pura]